jgi:hypothetical protein
MSAQSPVRSFIRWFRSARVTISLIATLAVFLFLNVAMPQEAVLGTERFEGLAENGPIAHFLLVTLGLGNMATSPVFLAILGLFFLNLAVVIGTRVMPTWRRVAMRPRQEEGLRAWARMEETFNAQLPSGWDTAHVVHILRGFGYPVRKVGASIYWGVKHRTAPLGFLLFHLSFFLLFAGGVLIYYTRFVGTAILSEGQAFTGAYSDVHRQPPFPTGRPLAFLVDEVEMRMVAGEPVHLSARLLLQHSGPPIPMTSEVNHPAKWGSTIILAEQAGVAPVLWLQDSAGFSLDRVVIPARARGGLPTPVELAEGRLQILIHPLDTVASFPTRDDLATAKMRLQVIEDGQLLFDDRLGVGDAGDFEGGRLVVEEIRYWVGVRIITERGGGLLIAGFLAAVLGLMWRLLWYRREVVVDWDESDFRLVGRSEYFSERFQSELRAIFSMLSAPEAGSPGDLSGTAVSTD